MIARQDDERCQLMPKSTNRRTSLQPVFEPFDLLEDAPLMPPTPKNGYHSEVVVDDTNSCNGHHCDAATHRSTALLPTIIPATIVIAESSLARRCSTERCSKVWHSAYRTSIPIWPI